MYATSLIWPVRPLDASPSVTDRVMRYLIFVVVYTASWCSAGEGDIVTQFETAVRPLLVERCQECHGSQMQSNGLRLDSQAALLRGGDNGPAIVPGQPQQSLLIKAVRHEEGWEMPPKSPLSADQIATLEQWVARGAYWPQDDVPPGAEAAQAATQHWAFQPIRSPVPPAVNNRAWPLTPVDHFVLARLEQAGLTPAPEADRRTLLRRLSYSLRGLPPRDEDVASFVRDSSPGAYERWVERYLESPEYGEHWARRWLDVARYSDTKGYVYGREERFWVHAWSYRDWVVQAFQEDLSYDRFLLLQLAADQVEDRRPGDLAAMGFVTLGRRFLGVKRDIIDDRIDVVSRGMMGLTVSCARCHDHKYDPIPTADYYSLYGVFDNSTECLTRLPADQNLSTGEFEQELTARQAKLNAALQKHRRETSERVRARVPEYLQAQLHLQDFPAEGFDQIIEPTDLIPAFVRRWQSHLRRSSRQADPVFVAWHAFAALPAATFAEQSPAVTQGILQLAPTALNSRVKQEFSEPPSSMDDVAARYGRLLLAVNAEWLARIAEATAAGQPQPAGLVDPAAEQLRLLLYGAASPCEVPDEPIIHIEADVDTATCTELWQLQGEVDRWILQSAAPHPFSLTLLDRPALREPRILRRGNPLTPGDEVPRQFLAVLAGPERQPFQHGSGRLELARAIIAPDNPLTARVIVNRVWAQHFGVGLVLTPSDFGTRAAPPSHPELLDWLAHTLIQDGWSLKRLQRLLVCSATFRQSSFPPVTSAEVARVRQLDPDNRWLWRMNPRRLSFEEYCDSLATVAGVLQATQGGKPLSLLEPPFPGRRLLYGLVDRQFLPTTLRTFDFANPDLHVPQRTETTVPQQALFVMNHPLAIQRARQLAANVAPATGGTADRVDDGAIRRMFRRVYQRDPSDEQLAAATALLRGASANGPAPLATAADWSYGYGEYDESSQRLVNFQALRHFTGTAWQGGPAWPDPNLGWVQLTAAGGHPGNDRQHAAVRRWTAPRAMAVTIQAELVHEPDAGDGVRAWVVSSQRGLLRGETLYHTKASWTEQTVAVAAGETIDFVVDLGDVLNSDQYLWQVTLVDTAEAGTRWNSGTDFTSSAVQSLNAWEQLAQVLLSTNEFLFVD